MTPGEAEQVVSEECVGVPTKERELGLLAYRDAIAGQRTLKEDVQSARPRCRATEASCSLCARNRECQDRGWGASQPATSR